MPVGRGGGGLGGFHLDAVNPNASTHRHFVLFPVSLALRDQDGGLSNTVIDIYN